MSQSSNAPNFWDQLRFSIPSLAEQAMIAHDLGDATSMESLIMVIEQRANDVADFLRSQRDELVRRQIEAENQQPSFEEVES